MDVTPSRSTSAVVPSHFFCVGGAAPLVTSFQASRNASADAMVHVGSSTKEREWIVDTCGRERYRRVRVSAAQQHEGFGIRGWWCPG